MLTITAVLGTACAAPAQTRYALPRPEPPVVLLAGGHTQYLVTKGTVYELVGRQLLPRYQSAHPITCALATDTALCLGTQHGALSRWQAHSLALPETVAEAPVAALLRDAGGALWIGAAGYGTYRGRPGAAWEPVLRVPGITAGATPPRQRRVAGQQSGAALLPPRPLDALQRGGRGQL